MAGRVQGVTNKANVRYQPVWREIVAASLDPVRTVATSVPRAQSRVVAQLTVASPPLIRTATPSSAVARPPRSWPT